MDIQILLYPGFDELDAIGPYEVFANAGTLADCTVSLRTVEETDQVTASHGLRVEPDGVLGTPDLLVVPGGGWVDRSPEGTWAEAERGVVPDAIADRHREGAAVASVCTGAMLLARGGVLEGRPAVTHHAALDDLRETAADVVEARVVDAGEIVTAGGVTSGIDLALYIVEREFGDDVADTIADLMEYERTRDVHQATA